MEEKDYSEIKLDKIIHERVRLMILSYLASKDGNEASFNEIKKDLDLTSGNLSVQIKNLNDASLIEVKKEFVENKPVTTLKLTHEGRIGLEEYVRDMEKILSSLKKK